MMNEFMEASTALNNKHVVQWKQRGKKVVGYTCSYVPDEIFHAAGILPFRIRGFGATDTTIGDTYFGPFICSLPKCMLQLAGEGKFNFLDGAIITSGCDSMRRLDECWRKAGNDIANAIPPFFFHFGVPHKYADYTITWFTEEIRRLIKAVEEHFKVEITDADLNESIHIYNESRTLLDRFEELRTRAAPPFSGEEALAVILAGTTMPREEYNTLLKKFIAEAEKAPGLNDRVRLMLVGSANDDIGLVRVMEGSKRLLWLTICVSARVSTPTRSV